MLGKVFEKSDLTIVILAFSLITLFYFTSPREFMDNLGYATLAILSLIGLIDMMTHRRREQDASPHDE